MVGGYWDMLSQDIVPQAATDRGFALSAVISYLGGLIALHTIIVPIATQEWMVNDMKNRDAKMRERYLDREDDRLLRKIENKMRKYKMSFYERTDKDREADEDYQRLLNIKAELERQ